MKMILRRKHSDSKLFQFCDVLQEPFVENRGEQKCVFLLLKELDEKIEMFKVAHKKRERTRQQASELKEMQKFLLIKVEHFFNIKMF